MPASQPSQRISSFRRDVKKCADNLCADLYGIEPGDLQHVTWLMEDDRYVYPHKYEVNVYLPMVGI